MLLRYHNQSVAGSGIGETVTMEEMIEMLRESVNDRMEAAHDEANATYEKLLPEVITASVLFALGQQVREMANEYEMDTEQINVIKNQQTGAYEYSYTADDLGDNGEDDIEPDAIEPEPDETSAGGISVKLQDIINRLMAADSAPAFDSILDEIYADDDLAEELEANPELEAQIESYMVELLKRSNKSCPENASSNKDTVKIKIMKQ